MTHRKMKITALLLLCCLLLSACGLGRTPETVHLPTPAQDPYASQPTASPTPALSSESEQRALIERSRSVWLPESPWYEPWYYAVTDLDHNGRLEVLTASIQGTGLFTYVNCWEVNESFTGLVRCPDDTGEGQAWPDIILDSLTSYRDPASGRYTYLCEDLVRDGAARYYRAQESFCLDRGQITVRVLAYMEEIYDETGASTRHFYDASGKTVTDVEYDNTAVRFFAGQEQGTLSLAWTQLEAPQTAPQPAGQAAYQPQVTAAPQPAVSPVTITKHPTGESIAVGGRAWFIAHAENANTLTWELVSPDGRVYGTQETMALNPGLELQVLEGDTIAVRNAPLSMNGWGVRARFDGPGGSATTNAARLTVNDYTTIYADPISKYRFAYQNGNTFAEYAYDNGISEYISSSQHVGYMIEDLDGDGVPELIIEGIGGDRYSGGVLYDLYTISDGVPIQVACSSARNRYYLRNDGTILNEGSGGAGLSVFILHRLQEGGLAPQESLLTYFMGTERDGYYYFPDGFAFEPGDYDAPITEDQFNYLVAGYEDGIVAPPLTQIW